jgi:hypothetical protein
MKNLFERLNGGIDEQLLKFSTQTETEFTSLTMKYLRENNPVYQESIKIRHEIEKKVLKDLPQRVSDEYIFAISAQESEAAIMHLLIGIKLGIALAK